MYSRLGGSAISSKRLGVGVVGEGQDMLPRLTGPLDAAVDLCCRIKIEKQVGAVADNAAGSEPSGCENSLR